MALHDSGYGWYRRMVMGHENRCLRGREVGQLLPRQQRIAGARVRRPGATVEEWEANAWHAVVLADFFHGSLRRGDFHVQRDGMLGRPLYIRPVVGFVSYFVIELGPVLAAMYTPGYGPQERR